MLFLKVDANSGTSGNSSGNQRSNGRPRAASSAMRGTSTYGGRTRNP